MAPRWPMFDLSQCRIFDPVRIPYLSVLSKRLQSWFSATWMDNYKCVLHSLSLFGIWCRYVSTDSIYCAQVFAERWAKRFIKSITKQPSRAHVRLWYPLQWFFPCHSVLLLWQCKSNTLISLSCPCFAILMKLILNSSLSFRLWWCCSVWTRLRLASLRFSQATRWHFCQMVWIWLVWCTTFTWCLEAMEFWTSFANLKSIWWQSPFSWWL